MVERFDNLVASVSHTTRPKRQGEVEGQDYFFVDVETFKKMQVEGQFVEDAEVFGNFYGTGIDQLSARQAEGRDVILEIDWQGARHIRQRLDNVISIFILPPSVETLRERLIGRGRDDEAVIAKRMMAASAEISHFSEYEFLIVNDDFQVACAELADILVNRHQNTHSRLAAVTQRYPQLMVEIKDF